MESRVYTAATDMTEFNKKYTKGSVLFVVLLIYEVPIVLNFLFFASDVAAAPRPSTSGQTVQSPLTDGLRPSNRLCCGWQNRLKLWAASAPLRGRAKERHQRFRDDLGQHVRSTSHGRRAAALDRMA